MAIPRTVPLLALTPGAAGGESLFGWYLGFGIAFVVIVVLVAIVAALLTLARQLTLQTRQVTDALDASRHHTLALGELQDTAATVRRLTVAARTVRPALEEG